MRELLPAAVMEHETAAHKAEYEAAADKTAWCVDKLACALLGHELLPAVSTGCADERALASCSDR
jgi:hypothetical protein